MALTQVDQGLLSSTAQYTGFKNRIINGAMVIDQRNAGGSVVNGGGSTYLVDRFLIYDGSGGSHFTVQQNKGGVTPPNGFKKYLGIATSSAVSASAGNNFTLNQYIEGLNVSDFAWGSANASAATLSFWVYSSLTGTFAGVLQEDGGTAFYVYTYTINSANTWTQITINVPGPTIGTWDTTNGRGINVRWDLGMGSNFNTASPNAWSASSGYSVSGAQKIVGTSGATFYITGVQLEKGSTATSFDYRPYTTELSLCQRYYYKNQASSTATYFAPGFCNQTTGGIFNVQFPVPMRTQPSSLENAAATTFRIYSGNAVSTQCTSINLNNSETISCSVAAGVASGLTAGQGAFLISNSTTAYLGFSAEL